VVHNVVQHFQKCPEAAVLFHSSTSFCRAFFSAGASNFNSGLVPFFSNRCKAAGPGSSVGRSKPAGLPATQPIDWRHTAGKPAKLNMPQLTPCLGRRCWLSRPRQPPSTTDVPSTYSYIHPTVPNMKVPRLLQTLRVAHEVARYSER
jgi:hypothetical protein